MKNNATLIIVGLVGVIIGAVVGYLAFGPGKPAADVGPAKYIVMFGDPNGSTMVTADLTAFQNALANPAPNWSTLQEVVSEGASPTPVPVPAGSPASPGTVLISRIQVIQQKQNNAPCTMHVTQKVGLNDPTQVRNVLAALNPSPTPVPR
jgi:hypothetical protein